jgi:hypothetical protein
MNKNGAIPFWSVDAFLTLSTTNVYEKLTPELISRLSSFVDAYILFDKVCLPQRYSSDGVLNQLGGYDVFEFIPSNKLMHSDDLNDGITFDIDLATLALPKIQEDDRYWSLQHDPNMFAEIYDIPHEKLRELGIPSVADKKMMSYMRLWLWSSLNEITEKFDATAVMPNSLADLDEYNFLDSISNTDYAYDLLMQFSNKWHNNLTKVSKSKDPYIDTIKNFPPFLAYLLDRANTKDQLVETLKIMRKEFQEIRFLRERYVIAIEAAKTVGEKRDIVLSWDLSWETLLKSDFKRTGFIQRLFQSSNLIELLVEIDDKESFSKKMVELFLKNTWDHYEYTKQTKQFKIFSKIKKDVDSVYFNNMDLYCKFGVTDIVGLK